MTTNFKCNEQRTTNFNKLDVWKEGRYYYIRKKWCIELSTKELKELYDKIKRIIGQTNTTASPKKR